MGQQVRQRVIENGMSVRVADGKTMDHLPATRSYGQLSVTHRLASCLNKRLDSVRFHYFIRHMC